MKFIKCKIAYIKSLTLNKIYKVENIFYYNDKPLHVYVLDNNGVIISINWFEDATSEKRNDKIKQLGI